MSLTHHHYMQRCFQLAEKGLGTVSPNPMVGAVLVCDDLIIGEGYHEQFGQAHAEINCFNNVLPAHRHLIPHATLYVNLEPCAHFGKTPPCANRIVELGVKRVVIANRDPFAEVDGRGISLLQEAGIDVITGVEENKGKWLNRRFFTNVQKQRPYIILKWAESADGFIGKMGEQIAISNTFFNRLVHKWRSEEDSIMIGSNTLRNDDPLLTNRRWSGTQPVRVVIDRQLTMPSAKLLRNGSSVVYLYNELKEESIDHVKYVKLPQEDQLQFITQHLLSENIGSLLVEGGAALHTAFIKNNLYDEIRVLKNEDLLMHHGVRAALLPESLKPVSRNGNTALHQWPAP